MNCIICNNLINDSSLIDIYFTFTSHRNNLLVNYIKKNLNCDLNKPHSKYICKECYNIFEELDFTELSCSRIRKQILDRWIYTEYDSYLKETSCQTDELYSTDSKEFPEISDNILLEAIKRETDISFDNEICAERPKIEKNTRNKTRDKENKSYQCTICKKRFVSKNGMSLHVQRQHESNMSNEPLVDDSISVDCNVIDDCSKSEPESNHKSQIDDNSSTKSTINTKKRTKKKHMTSTIKPLKYSCTQCPKKWRTMGELRNHLASHSTLRPYICEVCGQAYKHKPALDIHVGMHNGINPFSCHYCHKAFTQKGALQRHLPIHTGDAPYQCDLCGKRFVHHTSFNMHTLAHTGQKSYKCSICGLGLLSGSHLKRHMRVHTGERPYACTQCGKRFAERYNLAAHQRLHEAGPSELSKRLYRCQVCGAGFDRRPKLEEHLSNNHNKISENDPSRKWVGHILNNI